MSQVIIAPWSRPPSLPKPPTVRELSSMSSIPDYMKLMFGVRKWRVSFSYPDGSSLITPGDPPPTTAQFDHVLSAGQRDSLSGTPTPPYDHEHELFKTFFDQTADPKRLSNLVVPSVKQEEIPGPNGRPISVALSFAYYGYLEDDIPYFTMGASISGGGYSLEFREPVDEEENPPTSFYATASTRIGVVGEYDGIGDYISPSDPDYYQKGTIVSDFQVSAYGTNYTFKRIDWDVAAKITDLTIEADEYWSYGGKYNTSTGAPV